MAARRAAARKAPDRPQARSVATRRKLLEVAGHVAEWMARRRAKSRAGMGWSDPIREVG